MPADEMAAIHAAAAPDARPWTADEFAAFLAQPSVICARTTAAFALARIAADEVELLLIATHPAQQRRGLATRLMADWQTRAAAAGAVRAFLDVAADNHAARALYARCGYVECGRRPRYYPRTDGPAVDALVLARDLTFGQAPDSPVPDTKSG